MAHKSEFKAESKRLLEMMINSIYTHKEIFLREIISNASDAIDKLYYKSLKENLGLSREDFQINIVPSDTARTLVISDNGIGMTRDELENNLGTIAKSGSLEFKQSNQSNKEEDAKTAAGGAPAEDISIIGQFGVGFYSAFMVSKRVEVITKAYGADTAYKWSSDGTDGYEIEDFADFKAETGADFGTKITLYLKDDVHGDDAEHEADEVHEHEHFSDYTREWKLKDLITKYSDYIRYPIKMPVTKRDYENKKENEEPKETVEIETINSMVPIWKRAKGELTDEDYNKFYTSKFTDYNEPLTHIHSKTEGAATYSALLFIPKKPPFDYYTKEYEKGLQLYSSGVMIMEKCADLLPDHFSFVKGLVDSEDLSLNISREMLQHNRQLKTMAKSIERSIKNDLKKLLANDRGTYEQFWGEFGVQLKFGVYNGFGANKAVLEDLLMFESSESYTNSEHAHKYTTLAEYRERMREGQEEIYYASGDSGKLINNLPQVQSVKDKGFEILYLSENVDEFAVNMLGEYDGKKFKSVQSADFDMATDEEKESLKSVNEDNKDLFTKMKEALGDKVVTVRATNRLKNHAVCLTGSGTLSLEMEKVLAQMPGGGGNAKADKVLEINSNSPIFTKLQGIQDDTERLGKFAKILYGQALLAESMPLDDPAEYAALVNEQLVS